LSWALLETSKPTRGSADADTLAFRGKRIVWASETSEGRKLNASRIKELCGGDTLNARGLYSRDPVEFPPSHLLILLTNDRPQAPAHDMALWERIHLVPFNVRFVDNPWEQNERQADHDLLDKLKAEAPGILAWLVRGCLAWQREGLQPPPTVLVATNEYRVGEDTIAPFLSDRCLTGPSHKAQAGPLYKAYQEWAADLGIETINGIAFAREMQPRFAKDESGRYVYYLGVGLKE
jgi:putative DNA primase/helicase